MNNINQMPI
jgi:hypothetical protein